MYPGPFADIVKTWLLDADHPGIAAVQTCAEVGRWENPIGVKVTLADGWGIFVQMVGAAPPTGRTKGPDPEPFTGAWQEHYRAARAAADTAAKTVRPPARGAQPSMRGRDLLGVVLDVVKRVDHPDVVEAGWTETQSGRPGLRIVFDDRASVYCTIPGFQQPGTADFGHPNYQPPKEWM
jgi:hypothetical protein